MGKIFRASMGTIRYVVIVVLVLAILGAADTAGSDAACTGEQNDQKTATAQAVLDCGNSKCTESQGNPEKEQACLCQNCAAEDAAAKNASCTCGLSDPNSRQACNIYQRLETTCKDSSGTTDESCSWWNLFC